MGSEFQHQRWVFQSVGNSLSLTVSRTIALQSYEDRVLGYAQLLDRSLSSFSSEPVNATAWFKYFAFDVMTDIHYGQSLDMLKNGKDHYAIELSHAGVAVMGPLTPVPWLCQLLMSIPGAQKEWQAYQVWAHEELQSRIKVCDPAGRNALECSCAFMRTLAKMTFRGNRSILTYVERIGYPDVRM